MPLHLIFSTNLRRLVDPILGTSTSSVTPTATGAWRLTAHCLPCVVGLGYSVGSGPAVTTLGPRLLSMGGSGYPDRVLKTCAYHPSTILSAGPLSIHPQGTICLYRQGVVDKVHS